MHGHDWRTLSSLYILDIILYSLYQDNLNLSITGMTMFVAIISGSYPMLYERCQSRFEFLARSLISLRFRVFEFIIHYKFKKDFSLFCSYT